MNTKPRKAAPREAKRTTKEEAGCLIPDDVPQDSPTVSAQQASPFGRMPWARLQGWGREQGGGYWISTHRVPGSVLMPRI